MFLSSYLAYSSVLRLRHPFGFFAQTHLLPDYKAFQPLSLGVCFSDVQSLSFSMELQGLLEMQSILYSNGLIDNREEKNALECMWNALELYDKKEYQPLTELSFRKLERLNFKIVQDRVDDLNWYLSTLFFRPVVSYDLSAIPGFDIQTARIEFRLGFEGEFWIDDKSQNRGLSLKNVPLITVNNRIIGTPIAKNRYPVTQTTQQMMSVIYSADGVLGLEYDLETLQTAHQQHLNSTAFKILILKGIPNEILDPVVRPWESLTCFNYVGLSNNKMI